MNAPNKEANDPYYYELDSLNEQGLPTRKSVAEKKRVEREEKSAIVYLYKKFRGYLEDVQAELQYEKEKFQPLLILWFFASLFVNTLMFTKYRYIMAILFDTFVLFLGLKGINQKNQTYLYTFIVVLLLNFGSRFFVILGRLVKMKLELPMMFDTLLLAYEFVILYLIIKVEWLMRRADNINAVAPRKSEYEKPMIDSFDFASRKNTVSSTAP